MKIVKIIWYSFLGFLSVMILFILVCAFHPELTKAIAAFLYPDKASEYAVGGQPSNGQSAGGQSADNRPLGGQSAEGWGNGEEGAVPDGTGNGLTSAYVPPVKTDIVIPDNVSGRNGYQPVQEDNTQIADTEAEALRQQIGTGETGKG